MASQIPESWSVYVVGYLWTHLHVAAFYASLLTLAHVDNDNQSSSSGLQKCTAAGLWQHFCRFERLLAVFLLYLICV